MTTPRKIAAVALALGIAATGTGCAKRQIDPATTGSVRVEGTGGDHALQRFCDGPVAIYWTPGYSGEEDQYEFLVYDHPQCVGEGSAQPRTEDIPQDDE